jgi:Ca2+-binding RTX toxin-like protein
VITNKLGLLPIASGNDFVTAGDGNNQMYTSQGDDNINAGDGDKLIKPGNGNGAVSVGNGSDRIVLEAGVGSVSIFGFNPIADRLRLGSSLAGKSISSIAPTKAALSSKPEITCWQPSKEPGNEE